MSSTRLGATWQEGGTRFALRAPNATAAEVCLFRRGNLTIEFARVALEPGRDGLWAAFVEGVEAGDGYGFRLEGPSEASSGHRFDSRKLLIDPYARAIAGTVRWNDALLSSSPEDSAAYVPRSLVDDGEFDWGGDASPRTRWAETLIYECHVRGMTHRHPDLPPALRGTYLGLVQEPVLEHLRSLGVTALELMPVQHFTAERHLAERGRSNYWGYSPLSFFAPHAGYATGCLGEQVVEFKTMVRELHRAGIEVILDVVFNHTAEGGADGPTLGLRGIDNVTYYRQRPGDPSRYLDFTGCGNTLDFSSAVVRRLVLDCLTFWVEEMHVDGFRFDLATALGRSGMGRDEPGRSEPGRGETRFSARAPLFEAIAASPSLSRVKHIAEPWDLGPDGYQVGRFPDGWREWNDRYRDTLRRFWRGDGDQTAEMAARLTGSSDLFGGRDAGALASVNYVTCHDGFTLEDLVSYETKDNAANLENNRDGRDENLSSNWGVEGPTSDPEVLFARQRAKKNLLCTLAMSLGVPMLSHGDEMGRTQRGNNNGYCQDSEVTWVDWDLDARGRELLDFTRRAFELRRKLGISDRQRLFAASEIRWIDASGSELTVDHWQSREHRELGMLIAGPARKPCGQLLLLLNGGAEPVRVRLPETGCAHSWARLIETVVAEPAGAPDAALDLPAYSFTVLGCGEGSAAASSDSASD